MNQRSDVVDFLAKNSTWPNPIFSSRDLAAQTAAVERARISAQISAVMRRAEIAREFHALSYDHGLRIRRLRNPEAS